MSENFDANILLKQLKAFCKLTMRTNEECQYDGNCDDCPINNCIKMLENHQDN